MGIEDNVKTEPTNELIKEFAKEPRNLSLSMVSKPYMLTLIWIVSGIILIYPPNSVVQVVAAIIVVLGFIKVTFTDVSYVELLGIFKMGKK